LKKSLLLSIVLLLTGLNSIAQWEQQPSGTTNKLTSVYFINENIGHSVGVWADTVLITTDGGTTWNNQVTPTTHTLNSVFFIDANTGYAVGDSGTILKTTNGGSTWTNQQSGTTTTLRSVGFFDVNTGYAMGFGILVKTTNGGGTWNTFPLIADGGIPAGGGSGYFTDVNNGYQARYESLFGLHGIISKTVDGGTNWTELWFGGKHLLSIYFPDDSTGYAVGGGYYGNDGFVLKTANAGTTWTEQSLPTDHSLRNVYFADANTGYAVGDSGTILKTTNGGILWTSQNSGTFNRLLSVHFTDTNTGYIVGEGGIILKTTNGGITGVNNHSSNSTSLEIYPNPSCNSITIETKGNGHLSILNLNGQELITCQITKPKTLIDIRRLTSGVYLVQVTSEKAVQMGKFIKQ
jgi:photosystem II stability/assembly factor-like uncharacterized protein